MPDYLKLLLSTLHLRSNYSGVQQKTTSLFEESTYFVNLISNTIQKFGEIVDFTWFLVWNCHACMQYFFDTVWKNEKFTVTQIFFPSNQFIVKFFSKTLIWRNFCEKTVALKFRNFHSVSVEITGILSHLTHFWQKFRESNGFTKYVTK